MTKIYENIIKYKKNIGKPMKTKEHQGTNQDKPRTNQGKTKEKPWAHFTNFLSYC